MELALTITADVNLPLHRQIYEQVREAILTGRLRSRQRLPASRQLAKSLGVSRTTVIESYDELISEGYLQTKRGAGTFVCAQIPDQLLKTEPKSMGNLQTLDGSHLDKAHLDGANLNKTGFNQTSSNFSAYGDRLRTLPNRPNLQECPLSFRYGVPALDLFPIQTWRRLWNRHGIGNTHWMNYSPDNMGYEPLRKEIAHYIAQVRAVRCTPEQILITNGTQQALNLIVQLLINPGDVIAMENPGYLSARSIFISSGAQVLPVPVDQEGLEVDGAFGLAALSSNLSKGLSKGRSPRLVYVTPSHQFPKGVLMSLPRRLALLQWAQQNNALIIEDDYDSEFRYSGRPVPALQGLDERSRVLYVGTFSKVMFPGLRLGYIVLPPALMPLFQRAKWLSGRQGSLIDQQALSDFIGEGHLAKHIRRMRSIYEQRRRSLVTGLNDLQQQPDRQLSHTASNKTDITPPTKTESDHSTVEILGDESGLHVTARLPIQNPQDFIEQAQNQGVSLFSTQCHYYKWAGQNNLQRRDLESNPTDNDPTHSQTHSQTPNNTHREFIFGFGNIDEPSIQKALTSLQPLI